eukprot:Sdes_comp13920_c0_seq1m3335
MKAINQDMEYMMDRLENHLRHHKWLAGDHYSIADIAWTAVLHHLHPSHCAIRLWGCGIRPAVSRYYLRLKSRASFDAAIQEYPLTFHHVFPYMKLLFKSFFFKYSHILSFAGFLFFSGFFFTLVRFFPFFSSLSFSSSSSSSVSFLPFPFLLDSTSKLVSSSSFINHLSFFPSSFSLLPPAQNSSTNLFLGIPVAAKTGSFIFQKLFPTFQTNFFIPFKQ